MDFTKPTFSLSIQIPIPQLRVEGYLRIPSPDSIPVLSFSLIQICHCIGLIGITTKHEARDCHGTKNWVSDPIWMNVTNGKNTELYHAIDKETSFNVNCRYPVQVSIFTYTSSCASQSLCSAWLLECLSTKTNYPVKWHSNGTAMLQRGLWWQHNAPVWCQRVRGRHRKHLGMSAE